MFLTTAAVSAAKINAKVRSADISFHYSNAVSNGTAALTASGGGTRSGRTTVQVYEDNGCLYAMNKLRDRRGFTLTELLCAVLIVLLVSALLTVGVRFAGRTYNSSMQLSEAQELCSTLTSVISDKLRFCGTVTPGADGSLDHIFIQDLGSVEGEGAAFQVDADGQLTLGSTRLLSSAAYPRGLRVRDVSLRYDSASGIFTVTLQVGTVDSTLAETDFEVRRLNHT